MRLIFTSWPLLLALLAAGPGCSGNSDFGGAVGGHSSSKDQNGGQTTDGGTQQQDGEKSKATTPVQVAGSYLTADCGSAGPADGATATTDGTEAYGCAIENSDHSRYAGKVTAQSVTVTYVDTAPSSPAPQPAAPDSRYQVLFYLSVAERGRITSYSVSGQATSDQGVTTPFNVAATAQVTAAGCGPVKLRDLVPKIKSAVGDAVSALAVSLIPGKGFNGLQPRQLFTQVTLQPGDGLALTSSAGSTFPQILANNAKSTYPARTCPDMWRLYFKNAAGGIVADGAPDLATFAQGRPVPAGAVSASIGFYEPDPTTYADNEGMPGHEVQPGAIGGGGCDFNFELTHVQCSGP